MANMQKNARYNLMAQVRDGRFDGDDARPCGHKRRKVRKPFDGDRKGTPKFGMRDFLGK